MSRWLFATVFVALAVVVAYGGPHRMPPQQAIDACAKAKTGDTCSFKGRNDQDVSGTCEAARRGGAALVCRPQRADRGGSGAGSGTGSGGGSGAGSNRPATR